MSSSMIWTMTPANDGAPSADSRAPPRLRACRGSRRSPCRSGRARRRAGSGRGRRSPAPIVNSGSVSRIIQRCESSSAMRISIASRRSEPPRLRLLRLRQPAGQDRDEDDVVDAEDDLQRRQRRQRNQAGGAQQIAARDRTVTGRLGGREQRPRQEHQERNDHDRDTRHGVTTSGRACHQPARRLTAHWSAGARRPIVLPR